MDGPCRTPGSVRRHLDRTKDDILLGAFSTASATGPKPHSHDGMKFLGSDAVSMASEMYPRRFSISGIAVFVGFLMLCCVRCRACRCIYIIVF